MSFIDKNKNIVINRADSFTFNVVLNSGSTLNPTIETIGENDKIYFAVLEANKPFELGIIKKVYTYNDLKEDETLDIVLTPLDTEYVVCGVYYYQIKVEHRQEINNEFETTSIKTIGQRHKFIIEE